VRMIPPDELRVAPFMILDRQWALLVAGAERPNLMTISWGGLGTLWNRPVATIYVRPTRYTFSLLEAEPTFTLNFLPAVYRSALDLCGAKSGRNTDKWRATGLGQVPAETVPAPRVKEAELALECRVLATLDIDPKRFLDPSLEALYPSRDYHRAFIGEVLAAFADEGYLDRRP
jgi:flavin reductase (DIM6/NTAB) family NADH-FMN oxidoreductase RutF